MYFLWKRTSLGSIRLSGGGFTDCVNRFLPKKTKCRSLAIAEGETAAMTLVLSSSAAGVDKKIEKRLAALVAPLGFSVNVIWADRGTPGTELREKLSSAYQSPWMWFTVAALAALKVTAGWKGFFWTLFWSAAAWFVSKVLIALLSRR